MRGDALRFPLDGGCDRGRDQGLLAAEELFETDTEQRPVSLRDGEVAAGIEQGTSADACPDAFGMDEAAGEVAVAAGGGEGLDAADEHGLRGRYVVVFMTLFCSTTSSHPRRCASYRPDLKGNPCGLWNTCS